MPFDSIPRPDNNMIYESYGAYYSRQEDDCNTLIFK